MARPWHTIPQEELVVKPETCFQVLTHWGRMTHICVGKLTIIGSDNGLSPGRRQAIIWTNARILLIGPLGTNFNEISIEIQIISFRKMHLNMSSAKWRPFCLGLNELRLYAVNTSRLRQMVVILLTTFTNLFCWMKMHICWFKLHWSFFLVNKSPLLA